MNYYERGLSIIQKQKIDENENISDFWFKNKKELVKILYEKDPSFRGRTGPLEEFEVKLRWESNLGKVLKQAILDYITEEKEKINLKTQLEFKNGIYNFNRLELKFQNILFQYENKTISICDFANIFDTSSKIGGSLDLRGIDLSKIRLDSSIIRNVNFCYSNFSESSIQQTIFENVFLVSCDFSNSHLSGVTLLKNSHFSNSNFNGSYFGFLINKAFFNINYNKVRYWNLIKCYFTKDFKSKKFTNFSISKEEIEKCQDLETKLYIIWFVNIKKRILNKSSKFSLSNLSLFFEIVLTKYWSSYIALFFSTVIINTIFAILYYICRNSFYISSDLIGRNSFVTYLYYSFVTFTTLGYGDILPNSDLLRTLVIFEVLIGYSILGIFVLLLSNKINSKLSN